MSSTEILEASVAQAVRTEVGVDHLIHNLMALPQPPASTRHIYGKGIYMREIQVRAGVLLVGRKHKIAHGCLLIRGALRFFNADGTQTEMRAPAEFEASPGRKVALVLEDMTFVNTFETDETDVETLERQMFADEPLPDRRPMLEPDGDFELLLKEQGASAEAVRRASEDPRDLCPFPYGAYKVKVGRSLIEGRGLIATADIAQGEIIAPGTWGQCRTPAGRYTNHARVPNAAFHYDPKGVAWLTALRDIAGCRGGTDGEEITIDYRLAPRRRWESLS
jgi:hypothetical protein